jgi:uncharacterized repeat protein (TIGR01451 family)
MRITIMSRILIAAMGFALSGLAATAAAQDTLELRNEVFQEIERKDDAGRVRIERVPAAKVVPGSEVIYVITYRNVGTRPAENVIVRNPVPAELSYKGDAGFVRRAPIQVSVDGGASYGALADLRVTDSKGVTRQAQAGDVTHLRWTIRDAVRPGEQGSVSYRAVIR